jgi:hypothetical protein
VAIKAVVGGSMRVLYMPVAKYIPEVPVVYNPRLIMTNQGASSYMSSAPPL